MNAQDIVQQIQRRSTPLSPTDVRQIMDGIRSDAEKRLTAILTGVLMYHTAHTLAAELDVAIGDAEATAQTTVQRYNKLQKQIETADYAVRKAKADKIMLPSTASRSESTASRSEIDAADEAIRKAERSLQTARNNLQAAREAAQQRQRELKDLRAVHSALTAVTMPDISALRALLDELR